MKGKVNSVKEFVQKKAPNTSSVQPKNRLVQHAGLLLSATLVAGVTNYLFHIFMARMLGPKEYGVLFSLLSIFMIFSFPLSTVQMVMTKYVALFRGLNQDPHIRFLYSEIYKKMGWVSAALLGLFLVFNGHVSHYMQLENRTPVVIIGLFIFFSFLMPVVLGMLQGFEHFFYLSLNSVVGAVAKFGLGVGFVYLGFQVNGALLACVVSVLVTFVLAWLPLRDFLRRTVAESPFSMKEIYQFFLPVFAALSFYGLLAYPDVVLVKHWFSPASAGAYATAALLGKAFLFPAQSLAMAMFPKVSAQHARGEETRGLLRHTLLLSFAVLGAGLVITTLFPDFLAMLLLKRGKVSDEIFGQVSQLIRYYSFAFVPLALSYILMFYYLACHRKGFVLVLGGGTVVFLGLTHLFHASLGSVLTILGGVSAVVFLLLLSGSQWKHERV